MIPGNTQAGELFTKNASFLWFYGPERELFPPRTPHCLETGPAAAQFNVSGVGFSQKRLLNTRLPRHKQGGSGYKPADWPAGAKIWRMTP
jgi:hypothetical protein